MKVLNYYRIKTNWLAEKDDHALEKAKTEELVFATSYTEAEMIAMSLIEKYDRSRFGDVSFEIIKTKINELLYNSILQSETELVSNLICCYFEEKDDTGVGLYQVKVYFTEVDEKSGKGKHSTETIFTPAASNAEASHIVQEYLRRMGEQRDFTIRDTKFDKAEAIYWPIEKYKQQINVMS